MPSKMAQKEETPDDDKTLQLSKSETNLSLILRKRLENIEHELGDFNDVLMDFSTSMDDNVNSFA